MATRKNKIQKSDKGGAADKAPATKASQVVDVTDADIEALAGPAVPESASTPAQQQSSPHGQAPVSNSASTQLDNTHSENADIWQRIDAFAAKNNEAAERLGEKMADAEAAFPRTMASAYIRRKQENQAAGWDTATFLNALDAKISALDEFNGTTLELPSSPQSLALPEGTATSSDG